MTAHTDEIEMSRDEIIALIESEAQRRYGINAAEFVRQVRDGSFDECGNAADLIGLARLLGAGDEFGLAA